MQDKYKRENFINESEKFITYLCDQAFMKLWVYPNVYYETGKEFCDCIIIFENNILIFSVKDYKYSKKTQDIAWNRWKRKTVDSCIKQIDGAEKDLLNNPNNLYIDSKCQHKFPINFDSKNIKIYRYIVALGFSQDIGILYSDKPTEVDENIGICRLPKNKIYHILDSANYELIFSELNTINDFIDFYKEKENSISQLETFGYYGESTLLALYYEKMDEIGKHRILPENFILSKIRPIQFVWVLNQNLEQNSSSEQKNLNISRTRVLTKFAFMPAILFGIELLRQNQLMTANKPQCEGILFLLHSTQQLPVVTAVSKNGINSQKTEN